MMAEKKFKMALQAQSVIPDVFAVAPSEMVEVTYADNIIVQHGNILTPTQVKDMPSVKWNFDADSFYTLCMTDPDAPSRENPKFREWHHWLVGNIVGCAVESGDTLSQYIGAGPPKGTGPHRYVIVVYKQRKRIEFTEAKLTNKSGKDRGKFSIKKFAEKYKMGEPVAANFFYAEWDDYVPKLYKQLNCC